MFDETNTGDNETGEGITHQKPSALEFSQYREMHSTYQDMVRAQGRLKNQRSAIGRRIGYLSKGGKVLDKTLAPVFDQLVAPLNLALASLQPTRNETEKLIKQWVGTLDIWRLWGQDIRGIGPFSLGQILCEVRDLSSYPNHRHVWKHMGLAVMEETGERQRKFTDKEKAIEAGYSARRRSIMYVIGDNLIKQNRDGIYREIYLNRKDYEKERDPNMSDGHAHNRAKRVMEKQLLKDLWNEWVSLYDVNARDIEIAEICKRYGLTMKVRHFQAMPLSPGEIEEEIKKLK